MCAVLFYCVVFLLMSRAVKGISSRRSRWKGTFSAGLLTTSPGYFLCSTLSVEQDLLNESAKYDTD